MSYDLPERLGPLTDGQLETVRDAPSLPAARGFEMVGLPRGARQRLVAEVQHWREWSRRLGYQPPVSAKIVLPCPVCGKEYERVTATPIPLESHLEGQSTDVVEYIHEDGTRCLKVEDPPPAPESN